ncbi:MAG: hypothetical protein PVF37_19005 [Desulfobacterales bacterium]|jgi:hypothetical protein
MKKQVLLDVLETKEQGKSAWDRRFDKFACFYDRKFGPDWQDSDKQDFIFAYR